MTISRPFSLNVWWKYRDDGLSVFKNISGPQSEKIKKYFQQIFRENGLDIIIQCNMKTVLNKQSQLQQ